MVSSMPKKIMKFLVHQISWMVLQVTFMSFIFLILLLVKQLLSYLGLFQPLFKVFVIIVTDWFKQFYSHLTHFVADLPMVGFVVFLIILPILITLVVFVFSPHLVFFSIPLIVSFWVIPLIFFFSFILLAFFSSLTCTVFIYLAIRSFLIINESIFYFRTILWSYIISFFQFQESCQLA